MAPPAAGDVIAMSNGSRRFFRQGSVMNSAAQTFVIVAAGDGTGLRSPSIAEFRNNTEPPAFIAMGYEGNL